MPSGTAYLTNINNKLIDLLESMNSNSGYFYTTGTTQQEDFAKVSSWPLINVYLDPTEESLNARSFPNMNSYRNVSKWEIRLFHKNIPESSNSFWVIDDMYNKSLDDIKKVLRTDYTLSGIVEGLEYKSSRRVLSGDGSSIVTPKYLSIILEIPYSQDDSLLYNPGCV